MLRVCTFPIMYKYYIKISSVSFIFNYSKRFDRNFLKHSVIISWVTVQAADNVCNFSRVITIVLSDVKYRFSASVSA